MSQSDNIMPVSIKWLGCHNVPNLFNTVLRIDKYAPYVRPFQIVSSTTLQISFLFSQPTSNLFYTLYLQHTTPFPSLLYFHAHHHALKLAEEREAV